MSLKRVKEAIMNFFFTPSGGGPVIYASGRMARKSRLKPTIKVKFANRYARAFGVPFYRKDGDAGVDLSVFLPKSLRKSGLWLEPNERVLLDSGLQMEFPAGYYGRITHRSSTEYKKGLRVVEGIIDQGYRGKIYTHIMNLSDVPINIKHGDRLAQMIVHKLHQIPFVEAEELEDSDRGEGGFGSTGEKA